MINEDDFIQMQKSFKETVPKSVKGSTLCAFIAAIALDYADDDATEAQLILDGAKHMGGILKAVDQ